MGADDHRRSVMERDRFQYWIGVVGRHFLTFLAIVGAFWVVGKPHAQDFIEETVEERIGAIEEKVEGLSRSIAPIQDEIEDLQIIQQQQRAESAEQAEDQQEVLRRILQELQAQ